MIQEIHKTIQYVVVAMKVNTLYLKMNQLFVRQVKKQHKLLQIHVMLIEIIHTGIIQLEQFVLVKVKLEIIQIVLLFIILLLIIGVSQVVLIILLMNHMFVNKNVIQEIRLKTVHVLVIVHQITIKFNKMQY